MRSPLHAFRVRRCPGIRSFISACFALGLIGCVSEATPAPGAAGSRLPAGPPALADQTSPAQLLVTVALNAVDAGFDGRAYFRDAHGVAVSAEWPLPLLDVHCFVLDLPPDRSPAEVGRRLADDPHVRLVQPMNIFTTTAADAQDLGRLQHGLQAIRAVEAHRLATGSGVRVGVVDTGIDAGHPDLAANIAELRNFVGFSDAGPEPEVHGTAMAGVIGAAADDGYGITGVAPDVDLWGLRACWQPEGSRQGFCDSLSLARAVHFAIAHEVQILNLSLQGPEDPLLRDLIELALSRDMVLVAAQPPAAVAFPASIDGVIAVSQPVETAPADAAGPPVLAPGIDILSPVPGDRFDYFSGSSLAAAHVSGIAALVLERAPQVTGRDLADLLRAANRGTGDPAAAVLDAFELLRTVSGTDGTRPTET